jgi:hypothetical protein
MATPFIDTYSFKIVVPIRVNCLVIRVAPQAFKTSANYLGLLPPFQVGQSLRALVVVALSGKYSSKDADIFP